MFLKKYGYNFLIFLTIVEGFLKAYSRKFIEFLKYFQGSWNLIFDLLVTKF